ncbi:hypothetical protein CEUSTIGMA_g3968.t1 [Chlamydomonas eustigma]|uniref:UDP-N-acetylglucosamine--dolichyl-phosphate N-acetylglucosaminephosphotransferase n=1 Tax=Chlamydomonas eustigma TaxID=1157962 RepID=A0A250X0V9_9CHLO|nr:hypothetical protein CEUSTIGMA_g3968.t1 [Chlamydomonas eustigma]|eukprot:GAX76522.1 hypothetical protein CEUSTIGMA_g3968.t1 [Chlamydomonas eustigma]
MKRSLQLTVLTIASFATPACIFFLKIKDENVYALISTCSTIACIGFLITSWLIPKVGVKTLARGICGKDLNKKGTPAGEIPVPESGGLAVGCVFLLCVICFEFLHYYDVKNIVSWVCNGLSGDPPKPGHIPESWLVDFNAALAAIGFMMFLGFADDVLDIRWSVKMLLPMFAALPLLVAYSGGTGIALPKPLQSLLRLQHSFLELGLLYQAYMVALTIFCSNSINILAGVNGLEAGQTFIIACAILTHNLLSISAGCADELNGGCAVRDGHLFSAYLMLPLAGCTLGLLVHNWYPSRIFVGDTFTYFAGMTIAVAGILGHFSETLLLFLIPQIINFVYSLPQLFKIIPCPRHRLPVFDPKTGLLRPKDQPDWNVVNLMLQLTGNTTENILCVRILVFQAVCCALGFLVRWMLTGVYK